MAANALKRGNLFPTVSRSESQSVKQGRKWTITEMEEIIRRERGIRQQAQLAAEQALTAAKEAQKIILQLEEELEIKDQQLQQEREARKQAELGIQKVAKPAVHVPVEANQRSTDVEMTKCIQEKAPNRDEIEQEKTNSPKVKRPREFSKPLSSVSKKHRGADKAKEKPTQCEGSQQKMSLAEARKAAREEVEKRVQARANEIAAMKKN